MKLLISVFMCFYCDFCFYGCSYSKIWIEKGNAGWCNNPKTKTNKRIMDKAQIKNAITYLLDNCYFTVGDNVYKQVIGIPMGTDPAPFMANLFLYYYENKFMRELRKNDRKSAYKFSYVWRFIDDLSAVNNDNIFENNIPNIYPPELELKKENNGYMNASFLDLEINIMNKKFSLKLYDKRDDFGFSIVRMPHASNNMPSTIFFSSFCSEMLRIGRCTTGQEDFKQSSGQLMKHMQRQNENKNKQTKNCLSKLYKKQHQVFSVFFDSEDEFLEHLLSSRHRDFNN